MTFATLTHLFMHFTLISSMLIKFYPAYEINKTIIPTTVRSLAGQ